MAGIRGEFSSKLGFILAAAGSAVGIGNLVGFPVMASKNGGAAFLIIYIGFIALVCFPVMMAEIAMGRASQKNPVGAFATLSDCHPLWRSVGSLAVLTPFMIAVFYTVITVWIVIYMIQSAIGNLDSLAESSTFGEIVGAPVMFAYLIPLMALVLFILGGGVKGGIERAARILMPTLVVMLLALVVFVLTLDNAGKGLSFYLIPEFGKITSKVVNSALNHGFFSLSLGMGIMITYGSYLNKKERIVDSARMVAITDTAIAFIAGLLILPAVFAINPDLDGSKLEDSSISMMFNFLPQVFLSLQEYVGYFGASLVATTFFTLVFFAALTSLVSISEIPIAYLVDEKDLHRRQALGVLAVLMGLFVIMATLSFGLVDFLTQFVSYGGKDKSFFDLLLDVFYETILPLVGFIICLFCSYRWRRSEFVDEVAEGDGAYPGSLLHKYVSFSLGTFIPVLLLAVFANNVALIYFGYNLFGF